MIHLHNTSNEGHRTSQPSSEALCLDRLKIQPLQVISNLGRTRDLRIERMATSACSNRELILGDNTVRRKCLCQGAKILAELPLERLHVAWRLVFMVVQRVPHAPQGVAKAAMSCTRAVCRRQKACARARDILRGGLLPIWADIARMNSRISVMREESSRRSGSKPSARTPPATGRSPCSSRRWRMALPLSLRGSSCQ